MNAVNDVIEPSIIRTCTLCICIAKDNIVNMLAIDIALLIGLFEKFFSRVAGRNSDKVAILTSKFENYHVTSTFKALYLYKAQCFYSFIFFILF